MLMLRKFLLYAARSARKLRVSRRSLLTARACAHSHSVGLFVTVMPGTVMQISIGTIVSATYLVSEHAEAFLVCEC
jgi:hypothetical protein